MQILLDDRVEFGLCPCVDLFPWASPLVFWSTIRTGLSCPEVPISIPGWFNEFLVTMGTLFYAELLFNVEFHRLMAVIRKIDPTCFF